MGELSKVLLIAYACFWVMVANVIAGVKYVDPLLVRAARSLETGPVGIFLRVALPAALPRMFAGMRVSLGVAFMTIVGVEMIGTIQGLGALILEARTYFRSDVSLVGMGVIGIFGFVLSTLLERLERTLAAVAPGARIGPPMNQSRRDRRQDGSTRWVAGTATPG